MPKRVIEIPDELNELGDVVEAIVANVLRTVARTGGGKAVDYAQVETAVSEDAAGVERATHRAILQSLDIDVPAVIIGGVRYNRVGRCPAPYHTMAGSVSIERSLYRRSGTRGGTPDGKVVAQRIGRLAAQRAALTQVSGPGRTSDGERVQLLVNIGGKRDVTAAAAADSEGVGLFRTEFLFLDRQEAPSIDEQRETYAHVFDAFTGRKVVVRTLDAGADKPLGFVTPSSTVLTQFFAGEAGFTFRF